MNSVKKLQILYFSKKKKKKIKKLKNDEKIGWKPPVMHTTLVSKRYDFAKIMSDIYNWIKDKLQEIVNHNVPYMPCLSHWSIIAVGHGCASKDLINEMFVVL